MLSWEDICPTGNNDQTISIGFLELNDTLYKKGETSNICVFEKLLKIAGPSMSVYERVSFPTCFVEHY